eukprot:TRINITY_DN22288_c0_g1_i2.p2 TRINITY_DN22288_c0_g1~~TRINITY_DN22288_c0_g1_i2.p2  ORF type:complete len:142 (+),score=39.88 TRINITY_DN22288_c0_g1_i2:134-559(+)
MLRSLVGSEMCIRDSINAEYGISQLEMLRCSCWLALICFADSASVGETVAGVPPKGWNSWDGYQGNLNETEFIKVATAWADLMLPSGYDTVTIDEFWYPSDGESASSLDPHGRAVVDVAKWPSSSNGTGFRAVADLSLIHI